jgi:hypothetical protein
MALTMRLQLSEFARKVNLAPSVVVRRAAADIYSRTVERTPVEFGANER